MSGIVVTVAIFICMKCLRRLRIRLSAAVSWYKSWSSTTDEPTYFSLSIQWPSMQRWQENTLFAADSLGGCLEGTVCFRHCTVGHSCGLHHSSCRFWYVMQPDRCVHILQGDVCTAAFHRNEHRKHRVSADDENHVWDPSPSGGCHQIQADAPRCDRIRLSEMHCDIQSRSVPRGKPFRQHVAMDYCSIRLKCRPFPSSYTR